MRQDGQKEAVVSDVATAPENVATRPRFHFALVYGSVALAGLLLGAGASWLLQKPRTPDVVPQDSDAQVEVRAAERPDIEQAVAWFQEGRYRRALEVYVIAQSQVKTPPSEWLLRAGICQEELGSLDQALQSFRRMAAAHGGAHYDVATLAQARVLLRRHQWMEARRLLLPLALQIDLFAPENPIAAETRCLFALALAQESTSDEAWLAANADWATARSLDWLSATPPKRQQLAERLAAKQQNKSLVLDVELPWLACDAALERISATGQTTLAWTEAARRQAATRSVSISVLGRSTADLLSLVAAASDLCCVVDGEKTRVLTNREASQQDLTRFRRHLAEAALADAALHHPKDRWLPALYFAQAELAYQGKPEDALPWYDKLMQETPRSAFAAAASYKRGVFLQKKGQYEDARQALYRLVDQAPAHVLTPHALLRIGQTYLEAGDLARAASVLTRAQQAGGTGGLAPQIALTIAAAQTLGEAPHEALAALAKHRDILADDQYRATAVFLAALARYRLALQQNRLTRHEHELISSLIPLPRHTPLGTYGQHLIGLAYGELGMWPQMADTFEAALTSAVGPLATEMKYRLAEARMRLQQDTEATALLNELVASKGRWSHAAQFQLATIDLRHQRLRECVERCRRLLREETNLAVADVLSLMGQAYERQGEHARAAQCFAGIAPN